MRKPLFQATITFFILLINPFHIAHSQSQEAGDWIYIDSSPILGGDERQSKIQSFGEYYLNEKRIKRNDDIIILDMLMSGFAGMRYKDTNTGQMKEKPAYYDSDKKFEFSSEIWEMELKCDSKDKGGKRLVKYSNPRRYSERMGKGAEYTDFDTSYKEDTTSRYDLFRGEQKLPPITYDSIKKKFPVFCENFKEVLPVKEIKQREKKERREK